MQLKTIAHDFLPSLVVFLVALPLCMGIAIASGVPVALGLVTGIIGGLVVGFIAGSPLQVSGPAAGLAVIVWDLVHRFGLPTLGIIVFLAGVIQLVAGLLRGGRWFRAVPPAVIHGMLAGIGALIFASQFHVMVDDVPKGSGLENLLTIPLALWKAIVPSAGTAQHHLAAAIGLLTIVTIVAWPKLAPQHVGFVPGPLVGVMVATLAANLLGLGIAYVDLPSDLLAAIEVTSIEAFRQAFDSSILIAAVAVAVIASAETLLCATAVDRMHDGTRTNYDRELAAQGVGNLLCGLVGALPMTGVIVRSSANVQAGAKTRASAIMHGVWLLVLVAAAPFVLRLIPVSSLAAILVYTGWKLMDQRLGGERILRALARHGRSEVAIYLITVAAIVATDLLKGVVLGFTLAILKVLWRLNRLRIEVEHNPEARRTDMHLHGAATFLRLPELAAALESVPSHHALHVHIEGLDQIDHACFDSLASWGKLHRSRGGSISIDWEELELRSHTSNRTTAEQRLDSHDDDASPERSTTDEEAG